MLMKPPTVPRDYAPVPTYDDLVNTLELIRHATGPVPAQDGGYHEIAHELALEALARVENRKLKDAHTERNDE